MIFFFRKFRIFFLFFDVLCIALSATQTLALAILCADAFHLNEAYSEREEKERKGVYLCGSPPQRCAHEKIDIDQTFPLRIPGVQTFHIERMEAASIL